MTALDQLPNTVAATINGEAMFIHKGALAPVPAFIVSPTAWNNARSISDAQVEAMINGVTFGWNKLPDAPVPGGNDTYEFAVQLVVGHNVDAATLDDAIKKCEQQVLTAFPEATLDGINLVRRIRS